MRHKKPIGIAILVATWIAMLLPFWLAWRQVRQQGLNAQLVAAVRERDPKRAQAALAQGADPNSDAVQRPERTFWQILLDFVHVRSTRAEVEPTIPLLAWLVDEGTTSIDSDTLIARRSEQADLVKALLEHGADPNIRCGQHEATWPSTWSTPLIRALEQGHIRTAQILLGSGAHPHTPDWTGKTSLIAAAAAGAYEIANRLLDLGADPNARTNGYDNPLTVAADGRIVKLLLDRGAKPEINMVWKFARGNASSLQALLDGTGYDLRSEEKRQRRSIINVNYLDKDVVKVLLAHGADPNFPADPPLLRVLNYSNEHYHVVPELLAAGADVNVTDRDGVTSLMYAVANVESSAVRAVLAKHPNINARNKRGMTALGLAHEDLRFTYYPDNRIKVRSLRRIIDILRKAGGRD